MRRPTNVRRLIRVGGAVALSVALAWVPEAPALGASAIRARLVVGSLNVPTAFTFGPGNRIWFVEKATGRIRIHDLGTGSDSLFATVPGVNASGERGMLGIALAPGYPTDPHVYVYATRSVSGALRNQILRLTDSSGMGTDRTVIFSAPVGDMRGGTMSQGNLPAPSTVPPMAAIDGAALYTAKCAGCHGVLAASTKRGVAIGRIQAAISGNVGVRHDSVFM